ncbi:hypothetical protein LCGC14_2071360 [marine sediment metagenome]|uniref:Uncharacterized protein n=1 Tax=marine sediment metagenome TaxID=412755 RepID=A0A0F9HFC9_9ZZZZ
MSRYGFNVDNVEIVVGWDNPTQTFFGQTEVDGVPVVDTMINMGRYDIKDVYLLEKMIGFDIPGDICNKLLVDIGTSTPQTPLQKRMGEIFKPILENQK